MGLNTDRASLDWTNVKKKLSSSANRTTQQNRWELTVFSTWKIYVRNNTCSQATNKIKYSEETSKVCVLESKNQRHDGHRHDFIVHQEYTMRSSRRTEYFNYTDTGTWSPGPGALFQGYNCSTWYWQSDQERISDTIKTSNKVTYFKTIAVVQDQRIRFNIENSCSNANKMSCKNFLRYSEDHP